jgi:hypothetical protein
VRHPPPGTGRSANRCCRPPARALAGVPGRGCGDRWRDGEEGLTGRGWGVGGAGGWGRTVRGRWCRSPLCTS